MLINIYLFFLPFGFFAVFNVIIDSDDVCISFEKSYERFYLFWAGIQSFMEVMILKSVFKVFFSASRTLVLDVRKMFVFVFLKIL